MSFAPSGIAAAFAPLREAFGSRLRLSRDGAMARWSVDGREALVASSGGGIAVTFVDEPFRDSVLDTTVAPLYDSGEIYRLDAAGARRLANDLFLFFSGTREPRFRFVGVREADYVRA